MFGTTPAHGFFIRHVRGLEMQGVKIEYSNADARPAFVLEDVEDATFGRIKVPVGCGSADVCAESGERVQCVSE